MDTTPKNQDALRHNAPKPAARQSIAGEVVWTLHKGTERQTAELRTSATGVELQLARNGDWYFGRRHESRALALAEAAVVRAQFERDGWTEP